MSRIEINIKSIDELKMPTSDPSQIFVTLQNSERYNSQHSILYDPSEAIDINESFQISSRNPLFDSIILSLFYRTEEIKYNPIGTARLVINKLREPKSGDEKLPIFSFSNNTVNCGFINVSFSYSDISEANDEKSGNNLQELKQNDEYSSDSFSDSDDIPIRKKKRQRAPAAFRAANRGKSSSMFNAEAFKPKHLRKSAKLKIRDSELKERGTGATADALSILKKNKLLQKSISKLKIDPEKLKLFADYKACLDNNSEILNKARSEYKGFDNGVIRYELSLTTLKSIENCCELTQRLIDQIKKDSSSEVTTNQQQIQSKQTNQNANSRSSKK